MKINQLFTRPADIELLEQMVRCLGLSGLHDSRSFTKYDLARLHTVQKFNEQIVDRLIAFYLPCKAKLYLVDLTEKKVVTVVKQVLRLHDYCITAKEKNFGNKKVIVYRLLSNSRGSQDCMRHLHHNQHIGFD